MTFSSTIPQKLIPLSPWQKWLKRKRHHITLQQYCLSCQAERRQDGCLLGCEVTWYCSSFATRRSHPAHSYALSSFPGVHVVAAQKTVNCVAVCLKTANLKILKKTSSLPCLLRTTHTHTHTHTRTRTHTHTHSHSHSHTHT